MGEWVRGPDMKSILLLNHIPRRFSVSPAPRFNHSRPPNSVPITEPRKGHEAYRSDLWPPVSINRFLIVLLQIVLPYNRFTVKPAVGESEYTGITESNTMLLVK